MSRGRDAFHPRPHSIETRDRVDHDSRSEHRVAGANLVAGLGSQSVPTMTGGRDSEAVIPVSTNLLACETVDPMSDVPRSLGGPPVARTAGEDRWPLGVFATTHWSVILNAQSSDSTEARSALEQLCGAYWYPVYAHVRRHGHGPDDACDHTQEFFGTLLRREAILTVEPAKGRFRTFLLKSLDNFLADQADRTRAAKRGAGQRLVELDALDAEERYALEPAVEETPDKAFDPRWAAALMERVRTEQTAPDAPIIGNLCSSMPDMDEVADTLPDLQCWTTNQIAQNAFGTSYNNLSAGD